MAWFWYQFEFFSTYKKPYITVPSPKNTFKHQMTTGPGVHYLPRIQMRTSSTTSEVRVVLCGEVCVWERKKAIQTFTSVENIMAHIIIRRCMHGLCSNSILCCSKNPEMTIACEGQYIHRIFAEEHALRDTHSLAGDTTSLARDTFFGRPQRPGAWHEGGYREV